MLTPRLRALAIAAALSSIAPLAGCGDGSSAASGAAAAAAKPARMTFEVVLLDDEVDPFEKLPSGAPKGLASFQEPLIFDPKRVESRTFVRFVVQPGESLPQAMSRAKPWFDAIALPAGERLVFSEIREENEVTKKLEPVGVRTYVATSTVVLTRDDVASARVAAVADPEGKPQTVAIVQLTPAAGERFRKFTQETVFRRLGVMIDGNVVMAAGIQGEISGGAISVSLDPELPQEARRAELQRIADGLSPAAPAPSAAPSK
jgi:hypothetical protein